MATLADAVNATAILLNVDGSVPAHVKAGFEFQLDDELLRVVSFGRYQPDGRDREPLDDRGAWYVDRGLHGTTAAAHDAGTVVKAVVGALVASDDINAPDPFAAGGATPTLDAVLSESSGEDIASALLGANGPTAENPVATMADVGGGGLASTSVELSASEIATLGSVPVEGVAAPATGKATVLVAAALEYVPGTVPFARSAALSLGGHAMTDLGLEGLDAELSVIAAASASRQGFDGTALTLQAESDPGWSGEILTAEINAPGTGWSPEDVAVVVADTEPITAVNQGTKTFTVQAGATVRTSTHLYVKGSTGNDGLYTVVSVDGNDVTVAEAIPSAVADGDANHGSAFITVDTVDGEGAITGFTLTEGGVAYAVTGDGDPYLLAGPGGASVEDQSLNVLTISEDSDGTAKLTAWYLLADVA